MRGPDRHATRFLLVVLLTVGIGGVLAAGQNIVLDPSGSPAASIPGDLDVQGNRIVSGASTNLDLLDGGGVAVPYLHEEHDDAAEASSRGSVGARVVLYSGSVEYATAEPDTSIYRNGDLVVHAAQPDAGSFGVNQGDVITSDKPVGLKGSGHALPPVSAADTRFVFESTRYGPQEIYVYAPHAPADVELYVDEFRDGSPNQSATVQPGEVQQWSIPGDDHVFRLFSTSQVVVAKGTSGGGDRLYPPPASREYLHTFSEVRLAMEDGTSIDIDGPYISADGRIGSQQTADGSGGDAEMGLPVKMLGDTYVISHTVDDYAVAAIEPTEIRVYQWDGSDFVEMNSHDFSDASRDNPREAEVDDQSGQGSLGYSAPVLVTGTSPFYLRTNDGGADEYSPIGYVQGERVDRDRSETAEGLWSSYLSSTQTSVEGGAHINVYENVDISDATYSKNDGNTVTIQRSGTYRISYQVNVHRTGSGARNIMRSYLEINGNSRVDRSATACYIRTDGAGDECTNSATVMLDLSSGDTVEVYTHEERGGETGNDVEHARINMEYLG